MDGRENAGYAGKHATEREDQIQCENHAEDPRQRTDEQEKKEKKRKKEKKNKTCKGKKNKRKKNKRNWNDSIAHHWPPTSTHRPEHRQQPTPRTHVAAVRSCAPWPPGNPPKNLVFATVLDLDIWICVPDLDMCSRCPDFESGGGKKEEWCRVGAGGHGGLL